MNIVTLLGKNFLAERVIKYKTTTTTDGGIYLPPIVLDDLNTGGPKEYLVLQVSDKITEFKVGDRVICKSYTHGATEIDGGRFVMPEEMVIAVLPL